MQQTWRRSKRALPFGLLWLSLAAIAIGTSWGWAPCQAAERAAARSHQEEDGFDAEALFARSIVIDGTVNYYSTISGSGIGQPDFTRDKLGRTVKQATGIDVGGINLSSERSLDSQLSALTSGRFKGAMLIRSAADIHRAVARKREPGRCAAIAAAVAKYRSSGERSRLQKGI